MNIRYSALATTLALAVSAQAALAQQATPAASPQATLAPIPSASPAPAQTTAPNPASGNPQNHGKHLGQVKKLRSGTLTLAQVRYALTHPAQEAAKLRATKSVKFENLRVYRVSPSLRKTLHASASEVAYAPFMLQDAVAQTSGNPLLNILANINVSDALNNALNGNTVDLTLNDILNANNIGIGQVVGVYVGGGGIITTII